MSDTPRKRRNYRELHVIMTVPTPVPLLEEVDRRAEAAGMTRAAKARELVRLGLKVEDQTSKPDALRTA
jgi:hypothetical protein